MTWPGRDRRRRPVLLGTVPAAPIPDREVARRLVDAILDLAERSSGRKLLLSKVIADRSGNVTPVIERMVDGVTEAMATASARGEADGIERAAKAISDIGLMVPCTCNPDNDYCLQQQWVHATAAIRALQPGVGT